ncbi:MAG: SUMF1/EgtB/PvdO family nonheme iron enzyme [Gammaproteobacteria bacterium]|nr:SUMF1/EgtB/PvdO family nonheme iron enzyme [Gammaproteobacteria bacterium]
MKRRWLAAAAALALLWAAADWMTLEVGVLKPLVLGAGSLRVEANAERAQVRLDGLPHGETPLTLAPVLAGRYRLLVEHRFHPPAASEIEIRRGERLLVPVELAPAYGGLLVATNPVGASVTLNGERFEGLTPVALDSLRSGRYQVVLEMFGRETVAQTIEVLPGERRELIVELNRVAMSELRVRTAPASARVRLVDGPLPYSPGVRLPVGVYRIEVAADGYRTKTRSHRLHKGVNLVDVTLDRLLGVLDLQVTPSDSQVVVRTGSGRFQPFQRGVPLPTGPVELRIRKAGYRTELLQFRLSEAGRTVRVVLKRYQVSGGERLQDALAGGGMAPRLVVVPAGKANIGAADGDGMRALPAQAVLIDEPFAVAINEVSLGDYRRYAEAMNLSLPKAKGMDSDRHPVVNVSWREAVGYADWLSRETGKLYRLPDEREWAYVASRWASPAAPCQRGNIADRSLGQVFRQWQVVDCDDGFVRSAPIGSFQANALGVHDLFGNVAEWVNDCGPSGCGSHIARGSAWDSAGDELKPAFRESYDRPSDTRGFRVVREL